MIPKNAKGAKSKSAHSFTIILFVGSVAWFCYNHIGVARNGSTLVCLINEQNLITSQRRVLLKTLKIALCY